MKKIVSSSLTVLLFFSASHSAFAAAEPDTKTLTPVLQNHLKEQGDFCLGKFEWPIDVSEADEVAKSRDALQMPVLVKLGLVSVATGGSALRKIDDAEIPVPVKRYDLTEAGKKFYLPKVAVTGKVGVEVTHQHDFCAGKFSLDKIISIKPLSKKADNIVYTVSYTYQIAAAEWTHDADVQKVFPMLAKIVNGAGKFTLQQNFKQEGKNWVAVNPWR
jgi:hypothetical protein